MTHIISQQFFTHVGLLLATCICVMGLFLFATPTSVMAAACQCGAPPNGQEGLCIAGGICTQVSPNLCVTQGQCAGGVLGPITAPEGVRRFNLSAIQESGVAGSIGLLFFLNRLLLFLNIIVGMWAMFNFIVSGWIFLTRWGEPSAYADVKSKLTLTVVGITVIVGSYTLAGIIGMVFFGDASYILNPQLCDATGASDGCAR